MIRVQVANAEIYERWVTTPTMGDPAIARVDSRITMKLIKGGPQRDTRFVGSRQQPWPKWQERASQRMPAYRLLRPWTA